MKVDEDTAPSFEYRGKRYFFMDEEHKALFSENPEKFLDQNKEHHGH